MLVSPFHIITRAEEEAIFSLGSGYTRVTCITLHNRHSSGSHQFDQRDQCRLLEDCERNKIDSTRDGPKNTL